MVADTFPYPKADLSDIKEHGSGSQAANHATVKGKTEWRRTASLRLCKNQTSPDTSSLQSETWLDLLAQLRNNILIFMSTFKNGLHLPALLCNNSLLPPQTKDLSILFKSCSH